jgi:diguanylate cyclase (GGDEF)-like protein
VDKGKTLVIGSGVNDQLSGYLRLGVRAFGLMLAYYLAARFSMAFTTSPDGVAVIWLPNAFLLVTLLLNRGRHAWMLLLTVFAEIAADIPVFRWYESAIISGVNITEVFIAYSLLRRLGVLQLERLESQLRFLVAGPIISAFIGGLLGAAVIKYVHGAEDSYISIARVWWFGDALGLLVTTPLLLSVFNYEKISSFVVRREYLAGYLVLIAALAVYVSLSVIYKDVLLTPAILLPPMLYAAHRLKLGFTTVSVTLTSLTLAILVTAGVPLFGDARLIVGILHAQEFIFILSIMSLGFAVLMAEIEQHKHQLEQRVADRTRELAELNQQLTMMAQTDALTGLLNRRAIFELAAQDVDRCLRYGRPLAILMIDVDMFKLVNDQYGHQAGDVVLARVGHVLQESLRTSDQSARYGGEEFIVVAPEANEETASELAERLRAILASQAIQAEGHEIRITVSIGFSLLRQGDDFAQLTKRADEALYLAKKNGRNRVEQA